jgi:retinol dehydrogenase-12
MKTVLITGATAGIGKVTATTLAKQNYQVVIVGRNKEKTEQAVAEIKRESANPHIEYLLGDLSVMDDARRVAKEFNEKYEHLHLLINNAGGVYQKRELTTEGFEKTMATNHLSHFIITNLLLDKIKQSAPARIVNVSSGSHYKGRWNPDDIHMAKGYRTMWAYGNSKLYNVLFTKYLADQLKNDKVTVNCLHPGVVKTKIGNKNTGLLIKIFWNSFTAIRGISEEAGAKTSLYLATSPEVENITGKYFDKCKEKEPLAIANDKKAVEHLWKMSMEMAKF